MTRSEGDQHREPETIGPALGVAGTYDPPQTRNWSTRELAQLIDRVVGVSFHPDGKLPSFARVADAGISRFGQAWMEFVGGSSVAWQRDEVSVTITVEDA